MDMPVLPKRDHLKYCPASAWVLQHAAHTLWRWPNQQFLPVFAHSLSQEIKSLGDVRDERLFFRELQSALPEKLDDDRLDFLLQDLLAGRTGSAIQRSSFNICRSASCKNLSGYWPPHCTRNVTAKPGASHDLMILSNSSRLVP